MVQRDRFRTGHILTPLTRGGIAVTAFARNIGSERRRIETSSMNGVRGMAGETFACIGLVHAPSGGCFEGSRRARAGSRGEVEAARVVVVAHTAFEPMAIAFKEIILAGLAQAERPGEWDGNRVRPIAFGIDCRTTAGFPG